MEIPEETLLTFEHHEMDEMCSEPANPTSRVGAVTSLVSPTPSEDSQKAPPEKQSTAKAQKLELSPELRHGYRILMGVMSCSKSIVWSFLDPVDVEKYNLWDYHERVKEPMWLRKMESKFENGEYTTITEFVRDFRHMLENCYRYNGLDHWVSKQAMKLERIFEQKLNLMSRPIREKATHFLTSGGRYGDDKSETIVTGPRKRTASRALYGHDNVENSPIVAFIKQEEELNEIEDKRQKEREKKEEILRMQQEVIDWEVNLLAEPVGSQLRAMWEIPQIGHFLYICQSSLNIGEVVFYELERGFLMPRESSTFAKVFTSLLSTPFQRISLNKKPPMPYTVWETKLREKIRVWYKVLEQKAGDKIQASSQLGIDPLFFDVLGTKFVLDKKSYHELTFYQRVWIMKSMVDIIVENHQAIRDCINSMPRSELHAITLGHDSEGSSYIHFPHFCGADVRIYKQTAIPDPFAKPPKEKVKEEKVKGKRGRKRKTEIPDKKELKIFGKKKKKKMKKTVTPVPPVVRERPSRLRQRIIPVLKSSELLFETSESTYTSSIEDSEDVDCVAAAIQQSKLESNRKRNAESDEEYSSNLSENEFHTDENNIVIDKPTCKRKKKCEGIEDNLDADHDCLDNCQEKEKPCSKVMDDDDVCDDKSEIMELNFAEDKNSPVCQEETMENGCSSDDDALDDNEKENNTNELITDFADVENIKDSENDTNRSEIACNDEDKRTHSDKICVKDEQLPVEKKFQTENEVKKELSVEHKQCQEENISLDTLKKESVHIKKPINVVKQEKVSTDQKTKIELADEMTIKDTLDNDESEEKVNILKRELVNGKECPERTDNEDCSNAQEVTDKTTEINHTKEDEKVEEKEEEMIEVLPEKGKFELVCDSLDSLRELILKFTEPEPEPEPPYAGRGRKKKIEKPPPRKRCVTELHQVLCNLLAELEPWESRIQKAVSRNRIKMKKEWDTYREQPPSPDEVEDVWASEESSSDNSSDDSSSDDTSDSSDAPNEQQQNADVLAHRAEPKLGDVVLVEGMVNGALDGRPTTRRQAKLNTERAKRRARAAILREKKKEEKARANVNFVNTITLPIGGVTTTFTLPTTSLGTSVSLSTLYALLQSQPLIKVSTKTGSSTATLLTTVSKGGNVPFIHPPKTVTSAPSSTITTSVNQPNLTTSHGFLGDESAINFPSIGGKVGLLASSTSTQATTTSNIVYTSLASSSAIQATTSATVGMSPSVVFSTTTQASTVVTQVNNSSVMSTMPRLSPTKHIITTGGNTATLTLNAPTVAQQLQQQRLQKQLKQQQQQHPQTSTSKDDNADALADPNQVPSIQNQSQNNNKPKVSSVVSPAPTQKTLPSSAAPPKVQYNLVLDSKSGKTKLSQDQLMQLLQSPQLTSQQKQLVHLQLLQSQLQNQQLILQQQKMKVQQKSQQVIQQQQHASPILKQKPSTAKIPQLGREQLLQMLQKQQSAKLQLPSQTSASSTAVTCSTSPKVLLSPQSRVQPGTTVSGLQSTSMATTTSVQSSQLVSVWPSLKSPTSVITPKPKPQLVQNIKVPQSTSQKGVTTQGINPQYVLLDGKLIPYTAFQEHGIKLKGVQTQPVIKQLQNATLQTPQTGQHVITTSRVATGASKLISSMPVPKTLASPLPVGHIKSPVQSTATPQQLQLSQPTKLVQNVLTSQVVPQQPRLTPMSPPQQLEGTVPSSSTKVTAVVGNKLVTITGIDPKFLAQCGGKLVLPGNLLLTGAKTSQPQKIILTPQTSDSSQMSQSVQSQQSNLLMVSSTSTYPAVSPIQTIQNPQQTILSVQRQQAPILAPGTSTQPTWSLKPVIQQPTTLTTGSSSSFPISNIQQMQTLPQTLLQVNTGNISNQKAAVITSKTDPVLSLHSAQHTVLQGSGANVRQPSNLILTSATSTHPTARIQTIQRPHQTLLEVNPGNLPNQQPTLLTTATATVAAASSHPNLQVLQAPKQTTLQLSRGNVPIQHLITPTTFTHPTAVRTTAIATENSTLIGGRTVIPVQAANSSQVLFQTNPPLSPSVSNSFCQPIVSNAPVHQLIASSPASNKPFFILNAAGSAASQAGQPNVKLLQTSPVQSTPTMQQIHLSSSTLAGTSNIAETTLQQIQQLVTTASIKQPVFATLPSAATAVLQQPNVNQTTTVNLNSLPLVVQKQLIEKIQKRALLMNIPEKNASSTANTIVKPINATPTGIAVPTVQQTSTLMLHSIPTLASVEPQKIAVPATAPSSVCSSKMGSKTMSIPQTSPLKIPQNSAPKTLSIPIPVPPSPTKQSLYIVSAHNQSVGNVRVNPVKPPQPTSLHVSIPGGNQGFVIQNSADTLNFAAKSTPIISSPGSSRTTNPAANIVLCSPVKSHIIPSISASANSDCNSSTVMNGLTDKK